MKHFLLILLSCIALSAQAQTKLESGLMLKGGSGDMRGKLNPISKDKHLEYALYDNKAHFSIGYRFRLEPAKSSFFYDIDVNLGLRLWEYKYYAPPVEPENKTWFVDNTSSVYGYGSVSGTLGYRIYKKLSAGVGVEPIYYFYKTGEKTNKPAFDIPLTGRIAYDFGFIEISLAYKYGLVNTIRSESLKSGRFNDWQLSLYIPF